MDRYLSVDALNDIVDLHRTRSVSNKFESQKKESTSSFHLGTGSSRDLPSVEKGNLGLVTRAQDESLASSNSTNEQIYFEGNKISGQPTTNLSDYKLKSSRRLPPHDISEVTREGGKNRHSMK